MTETTITFDSAELKEADLGLRFSMPMYGDHATGFVVRFQGQVYAYVNQCAHVPIELDWQQGEFFTATKDYLTCSTHGAHYVPNTGECVMGPCKGKQLKPMQVVEEGHKITVDLQSAAQYFA